MYRKKLTYSICSIPFAVVTFSIYDFHQRKRQEKLTEMDIRKSRIHQEPQYLNLNNVKEMPWTGLSLKEFNEQWAYKPFFLYGQFDHTLEVKVERIKEGERGYLIITPFFCYSNEKGESSAILVDRGWVEGFLANSNKHRASPVGPCMITGVLYKGNSDNKYSQVNYPAINEWYNINLEQIAKTMDLNNVEQASQGLFKQVHYDDQLKTLIPVAFTPRDLFKWTITPENHKNIGHFWLGLTYLNIFFNTFLWLYL